MDTITEYDGGAKFSNEVLLEEEDAHNSEGNNEEEVDDVDEWW